MQTRHWLAVSLVVTVLLLGAGSYLAYSTFTQQTQATTEVEATILDSEFEPEGRFDDDYRVHIEYQYTYAETEYTSTNVFPGASSKLFDEKEQATEIVEQYRTGTTATAYVNPDAPSESYLVTADTGGTILGTVVLLGLGLLGLLVTGGIAASLVFDLTQPDPEAVRLSKPEVRHELLTTFEQIDSYPITDHRAIRMSSLDRRQTVDLHEFEVTVGTLDSLVATEPETPCETPEELTEFFLTEMEKQGYFAPPDAT